jgi:hypothetical protein
VTPRRRPLVPAVVILVLLALSVFLWYLSRTAANPEWPQLASGVTLGAAIVVLLLRVLRRG